MKRYLLCAAALAWCGLAFGAGCAGAEYSGSERDGGSWESGGETDAGRDAASFDASGMDGGVMDSRATDSGALDTGPDSAGGVDAGTISFEDWGDPVRFPALGGVFMTRAPLAGTSTFDAPSGTMVVQVDDQAQTIVIGVRAEDGAIVVNGQADGSTHATATTLRTLRISAEDGAGADQTVVLDGLYGAFSAGPGGDDGIWIDLGDGVDTVRIRTTAGNDIVTFGSDGISLNTDARVDIHPTGVEVFDVSLGAGDDVFSAEGGSYGAGASAFGAAVIVHGGDGSDEITGGPGDDTLYGGADGDLLRGRGGDDAIRGGSGDDAFGEGANANGADVFVGGEGIDTVDYSARIEHLDVTMDGRIADDGELDEHDNVGDDVEGLLGGSAGDFLTGNDLPNVIRGYDGNDAIRGGPGNDLIDGGNGDDRLDGGPGDNHLICGGGNDEPSNPGNGAVECPGVWPPSDAGADGGVDGGMSAYDAGVPRGTIERAGLVGWFKADAIPAPPNNQLFGVWPNSADPSTPAVQDDLPSQPVYVHNAQGGLPTVLFVETARLVSAVVPARGAGPRTVFMVAKGGAITGDVDRSFFYWGDAAMRTGYGLSINAEAFHYAAVFSMDRHYSGGRRLDSYQVVSARYDGSNHWMWIDGASAAVRDYAVALNTGSGPLSLGGNINANIAELIFYDIDMPDNDREGIECALQQKWSTPTLGHGCI